MCKKTVEGEVTGGGGRLEGSVPKGPTLIVGRVKTLHFCEPERLRTCSSTKFWEHTV